MREYRSADIRNVAVVGHGASGKTTLVDALAFVSGSSKRHGSVKDGTALTDHTAEEIDRGFSINLGCAFAEWMDTKINLIDTPGYLDFQGDARRRTRRRGRCTRRRERDRRRRSRNGEDVPRGGEPRRPGAVRRVDDGQGERELRRDLPADQTAPDVEGDPGRSADRQRAGIPRHHEPVREVRLHLQAGHEVGRVRRGRHPRRRAGDVRSLPPGADRSHLRDRRHAARALSRGCRDRARRGDSRE